MTHKRILAAKIAQDVANHIEGTGTIIVQNMEEVIHDALLLDGAKRIGIDQIERVAKRGAFDRNFEAEMHEAIRSITGIDRLDEMVTSTKPSEHVKFLAPKHPWWQIEPGPEAGE